MKHIDVTYVDLVNIAGIILKEGTVSGDEKRVIIGMCKDINIPIILTLIERESSCILINYNIDTINTKIIYFYFKAGIYCKIQKCGSFEKEYYCIELFSLD